MSNSHDFCWTDYLELAREPVEHLRGREAHFRGAIGRAYYAAFHTAMGLPVQEGFKPAGTGDGHHKVWGEYRHGSGTGRERKRIAQRGFDLLYDRVEADYRLPFKKGRVRDRAELALKKARYIVDWVRRVQERQRSG